MSYLVVAKLNSRCVAIICRELIRRCEELVSIGGGELILESGPSCSKSDWADPGLAEI